MIKTIGKIKIGKDFIMINNNHVMAKNEVSFYKNLHNINKETCEYLIVFQFKNSSGLWVKYKSELERDKDFNKIFKELNR